MVPTALAKNESGATALAQPRKESNGNGSAHLSSANVIQLEHEYGAHK